MPTRDEALDFLRDSRREVPAITERERVAKFRRQNLSLKLSLSDDDALAILETVDLLAEVLAELPTGGPFPVRES